MDYSILLRDPLSLLAITFLFVSIGSLWGASKALSWLFFILFIVFSWIAGRISHVSCLAFLGLYWSYKLYIKHDNRLVKIVSAILFFLLSLFMLLYKVPGINNWILIANHQFAADTLPYHVRLDYGVPVVGFLVLMLRAAMISSLASWKSMFKKVWPFVLLSIPTLIFLAFILGYINFDPKSTNIFFIWTIANLLFICITEEALFRLFIQDSLIGLFRGIRIGNHLGVVIASLLFGIAHFAGGPKYVFLAAVSGLFYGYAYYKTKRIEASIITHFLLNVIHFLFFSYPALIGSV